MVDPARVRSKLAALEDYAARLRELADLSEEQYVGDHAYEGRYLVQASSQVCVDLANHLIASRGWVPPQEFRESFTRLAEHGVLADDLTERLRSLTGLRNRLVHLYDEVDDRLVHQAMATGLADLDAFARSYTQHLDQGDKP